MNHTHNEAIALFTAGNIDAAWEVAKLDEGLMEGVSKEAWVNFANKCVETARASEAAETSSLIGY